VNQVCALGIAITMGYAFQDVRPRHATTTSTESLRVSLATMLVRFVGGSAKSPRPTCISLHLSPIVASIERAGLSLGNNR
jgi:hypothetical protein